MAERRNIKRLIFLFCTTLLVAASGARAQSGPELTNSPHSDTCLRLGTSGRSEDVFKAFHPAITAVYEAAGYCERSVRIAPKRIEQMILAGTLDGDWVRAEDYETIAGKHLVPVPEAIFSMDVKFLSIKNTEFQGQPENLAGLRVGYLAGFRWAESRIIENGGIPVQIPSGGQILELLKRQRFDVYVTLSPYVGSIINRSDEDPNLLKVDQWATLRFYHMLHERHVDKVKPLQKAIREAKSEGVFDALYNFPGIDRPAVK